MIEITFDKNGWGAELYPVRRSVLHGVLPNDAEPALLQRVGLMRRSFGGATPYMI